MASKRFVDVTSQEFLDDLTADESFDEIYSYGSEDEFGEHLEVDLETELPPDDQPWTGGSCEPINIEFKPKMKPGLLASTRLADPEPIDIFKLFVTDENMACISSQTNLYAGNHFAEKGDSQRKQRWTPTCLDEMWAFFGLIVAMGLVQISNMRNYWSTDDLYKHPFFPTVMSRDRFLDILSLLHLNDNSRMMKRGEPGFNPLHKVDPFLVRIKQSFKTLWQPFRNISVDEAMIAWKGNLSFRVFNKDKPDKYGIKVYQSCDSSNGYCLDFEVYTGKKETSSNGATYDVVMRLISSFLNQGYTLFVDNFYTSPQLFKDLLGQKTNACGTLRVNRKGVDPSMKKKKMVKTKGDSVVMNNGKINHVKFMDNKEVNILTTKHDDTVVTMTNQRKHSAEPIQRFEAVNDYNHFMGGVDRSDQLHNNAAFKRRTLKWWKKVFFHFFLLAEVNAYLWYKHHCTSKKKTPLDHCDFRKELAKGMVRHIGQKQTQNISTTLMRLSERHFPSTIRPKDNQGNETKNENKEMKDRKIWRRCFVCYNSVHKVKYSYFECRHCGVTLCVAPCFEIFHTKQDFSKAYKNHFNL